MKFNGVIPDDSHVIPSLARLLLISLATGFAMLSLKKFSGPAAAGESLVMHATCVTEVCNFSLGEDFSNTPEEFQRSPYE